MQIGRRIYYEYTSGYILIDTGEKQGSVVSTTIEQDIETFKVLSERNRESFDVLELEFGQYAEEFAQATSYRVNPTTKQLEFNYDRLFDLAQYKSYKIDELKKKCQEDIQAGFIATNTRTYRTNYDDQLNFLGKFNQLMSDTTITTVMWKTEDAGYIQHTREEWLNIYSQGLQAKEQKLFKYEQLKQLVTACTTKEEVEAIIW